ncbi:hypothetical protein [Escherichia coli]|uniref:hypothetical protein n=1 Tax=Escherichia coli TaxID=562 RepID=UPI0015969060|nr:hypothetical protein [Escherichia coli]
MTDLQQTYYRQVKNPNPVFTPRKGAGTLKFCEKLMEKAVGFTSRFARYVLPPGKEPESGVYTP